MTIERDVFQPHSRDSSAAIADYFRRSISLSDIFERIWRGRNIVAICLVLGIGYGIYAAWKSGPLFAAEMSLLPAESNSADGGGSAGSGTLGLIAGLTGTNLGSVPKFTQFLAALHSTAVAKILDQKYAMSCRVFRGDCDQKTLQWRERSGMRAWFNGVLARLSGLPDPNGPHTPTELAAYIDGAVTIAIDKTSQVVKVNYQNQRSEFATQFLSVLVRTTNDYIKAQDRGVMRQYVQYITAQASNATNVAHREALDQLLLQQERKLMLTEVDVPYAASILDGPTVFPVNKAARTIAIYSALGLIVGALIALGKEFLRRHVESWSQRWKRY